MTKKEWERLAIAIKEVIQSALRHHGTTFRNYQDADGNGDNFRYLKVYHRGGKPCPLCGKTLTKTKWRDEAPCTVPTARNRRFI